MRAAANIQQQAIFRQPVRRLDGRVVADPWRIALQPLRTFLQPRLGLSVIRHGGLKLGQQRTCISQRHTHMQTRRLRRRIERHQTLRVFVFVNQRERMRGVMLKCCDFRSPMGKPQSDNPPTGRCWLVQRFA